MIDVSLPIRTAVIGRLRGNIVYEGVSVSVFGRVVPEEVEYPFIYLPNQLTLQDSSKTNFGYNHTLNIECVYRRSDGSGNDAVDIISGQVLELLLPFQQSNEIDISNADLTVVKSILVDETDIVERTDTFYYFRKIIRIEFSIREGVGS